MSMMTERPQLVQLCEAAMEEQTIIDAQGSRKLFPHFWEHMFGSCHAPVALCEDWRNDLRALREIVDVPYITQ